MPLDFQPVLNALPTVMGAVIGFVGGLLANAGNNKRLRIQLEHDARERERDRLATLRRDVYLQAPREAVKAFSYLGKLVGRDLSKINEDEGISGFSAVASQIGVLSDVSTATAVGRMSNALATELLNALRDLREVQSLRVDIELRQQRLEIVTNEINRMQSAQQAMGEAGEQSQPRKREGLTYWINVRMKEADKLRVELEGLYSASENARDAYLKRSFERFTVVSEANIQMMREIRREIGLVKDLDVYEEQMRQMFLEMRREASNVINSLSRGDAQVTLADEAKGVSA